MKYAFIEAHSSEFSIRLMCRALGVSRSGYYDWRGRKPSRRARENAEIGAAMKRIHQRSRETYGGRRLWRSLLNEGYACGRHRIERLRRENGMESRRRKRFKRAYEAKNTLPAAPNRLAQRFTASAPNQVWVGDITFIPTRAGWLYLAVIIDLYSRKVVGWSMSPRATMELVSNALEMAAQRRRPAPGLIHHTDQGSQYTSYAYQQAVADIGALSSMSRRGNCYDNAVAESFFSTLKAELIYHRDYRTHAEARGEIFEFIEVFYNRQRIHQSLNYRTPDEYERMYAVA